MLPICKNIFLSGRNTILNFDFNQSLYRLTKFWNTLFDNSTKKLYDQNFIENVQRSYETIKSLLKLSALCQFHVLWFTLSLIFNFAFIIAFFQANSWALKQGTFFCHEYSGVRIYSLWRYMTFVKELCSTSMKI